MDLVVLATEAQVAGSPEVFVKGILAFLGFMVFFVGGTWLLAAMILGTKLGYFVTGASLFAVMTIISAIWFVTALGPVGASGFWGSLGEQTAWNAIATGPELTTLSSPYGELDVADYPNGEWVEPSAEGQIADLGGDQSTAAELANVRPVMEALVANAVSPIPGIRERAEEDLTGEVNLESGNFAITEVRMKETTVAGKDSIVAVGRAVPRAMMLADLGEAAEGELTQYLVEIGDEVNAGDPVAEIQTNGATTQLMADRDGRILALGFGEGDAVKPDAPFATLDISGQPDAPDAVEVAAARVRGSVRVPSFIYLVVSLLLLGAHLVGLNKIERAGSSVTQPQTA